MASKRRIRRKKCKRKKRHRSEDDAVTELKRLQALGILTMQHGVYKCKFCNGWHIGRRPKSKLSKHHKVWQSTVR